MPIQNQQSKIQNRLGFHNPFSKLVQPISFVKKYCFEVNTGELARIRELTGIFRAREKFNQGKMAKLGYSSLVHNQKLHFGRTDLDDIEIFKFS